MIVLITIFCLIEANLIRQMMYQCTNNVFCHCPGPFFFLSCFSLAVGAALLYYYGGKHTNLLIS